jgi:putative transcriptional regulator
MINYINNKVLLLRKQRNATQEELAENLGVSRQTVIAIEKGNYVPSLLLGIKIAKFFKKSVEQVFEYKYEK